jgi:chloramphenicol-sensitive protein RarD
MKNIGIVYALSAYFIWGMAPIFWRLIDHIPSLEIVAHRMLWSTILVLIVIVIMGQWRQFSVLIKQRKMLGMLFMASLLISINWGVYIWAVNSGHIVESAMGYFINPLVNVLLGVIFFRERLRITQSLAIGLVVIGVAYLIFVHGEIPYIALTLALTFGVYGALKKTIVVPATHGMAIETGLMVVPVIAYLAYLNSTGNMAFGQSSTDDLVLILGGAFTLAPLLFFAAAARRISMTSLGMTQYLGPTLQLILGIWVFNEPFGPERQIAFGFIWLALLLYTADQLNNRRLRRVAANTAGVVVKSK